MLGLLLICATALQGPHVAESASWVRDGADPARPTAQAFTGTVELTPAEALETARAEAIEAMQRRAEARGRTIAEEEVPFWLPAFVENRVVSRWTTDHGRRHAFHILDREDIVRDHGFGRSFQTHLLVEPIDPSERSLRHLQHQLRDARQMFLMKCGGTVVFWGLLAMAFWWLDRLSRGYMSGRLALVSLLLGTSVPAVAFLLI